MRNLYGLLCVFAMSAVPLVGCSDSGGEAGGEGGNGGPARAEIRLFIQGWEPSGATGALAGVEACELDADNCVTTDDDGNAVLLVPVEQEVAVTYVKDGHGKYLDSFIVPEAGIAEAVVLASDARFGEMHGLVGSPYPMEGTGTIFLNIANNLEGATLALVGDATGTGWYRDEDLDWDRDLTATTSGGGGGFSEVAPGVVQVDVGDASCTLVSGWPGDADNRFKLPIKEGYMSRVDLSCEAQ